jgi:soluble lytic murein transglycosylase-like protein
MNSVDAIYNQTRANVYSRINARLKETARTLNSAATKKIFTVKAEEGPAKIEEQIDEAVKGAANQFNLDPNLIRAIIRQESNFDPNDVSKSGAMGLMQLMPETAKLMGVENPLDIKENIYGGSKYLKNLLDSFDGDLTLALAAYNAGPGAVRKHGGVPPYKETQNYVPKVLGYVAQYALEQYAKNL